MNASQKSILGLLLLAGTHPSAQADFVLAAGGVWGGSAQHKAYCYIFNAAAAKSVSVVSTEIIHENGAPIALSDNTCKSGTDPSQLNAKRTCFFAAGIQSNATYACRAVIGGKKAPIRGTMDIRDSVENLLISTPLD
jgi:hypothetical protein